MFFDSGKVIALDFIAISPRVHSTWLAYAPVAVQDLVKAYPDLESSEIPDEQFRYFRNGKGEIFITVRKKKIAISVPANEWEFLGNQ